jgi:4-carboxymuconolactone decarboxylase
VTGSTEPRSLSARDRRLVSLVCAGWAVDEAGLNEQISSALHSGDLTIAEINEFTLHFAVYCGWPKASAVEMAARTQWNAVHLERGETPPQLTPFDIDDLGTVDPAQRIAEGAQSFADINLVDVWLRPGLCRRDRRIITVACVGVAESPVPIWSHVTSALGSGDLALNEVHELIVHFGACTDEARANALRAIADQWSAANP